MSHRIVSAVIGVVLVLFGLSGLLFAVGVAPPGRTGARPDGAAMPATHRSFDAGSCATCHPEGSGVPRPPGGP